MKKTISTAAFALALSLTACGSPPISSDNSTGDSLAIRSDTSYNSANSGANESSASSGAETSGEEAPKPQLPENFNISDYITDFDDAALMSCSYVDAASISRADESAVESAVEAYESSEAYSEALELAKQMFYYENGELLEKEDSEGPLWLKKGYADFIVQTETSEIAFRRNILSSVKFMLDGEIEESIVLLGVPLPESMFRWSGHAGFHIPVYVNAAGEAHILYDACCQDYGSFKLLEYSDGTVHALFDFGHNESGQRSTVYSFKNGTPKLELSGSPISLYCGMLMGGYGWHTFEPFMLDADSAEFCAVAAVSPSEELAEIICSDNIVLSYLPNAREMFQNGKIQIIGGKYVTFNSGIPWSDYTFIFNSSDNRFELVEPVSAASGALPDQVEKSYNVKL